MLRCGKAPTAGRATVKSTAPAKSSRVIEVVAVDENSAVGDIGVVVVNDTVVMPVRYSVVPSSNIPAIDADYKAQPKRNSRTGKKESWILIPARPDPDGLSIHEPRIVLWHVNDLRIGWFDHYGLPLIRHLFL